MRAAALVAAIGFLAIAIFQAVLALDAPLGRAGWGGRHVRLPTPLRIASGVAVVIWVLAGLIVLARAGYVVSPFPDPVERWAVWAVVGLLAVGTLMNAASSSRWERFLWAPVAFTLAVLSGIVALG